jgi:hypothetical protein
MVNKQIAGAPVVLRVQDDSRVSWTGLTRSNPRVDQSNLANGSDLVNVRIYLVFCTRSGNESGLVVRLDVSVTGRFGYTNRAREGISLVY